MHRQSPQLSRIIFPRRTLVVAAVIVLAAGAAFTLGYLTAPNRTSLQTAATATVNATAQVELRNVEPSLTLQGNVSEGNQLAATPATLPEQPVVTKQELQAGIEIHPGMFLGSIANTPIFAVQGPLPLYRDLVVGDSGDDVRALQSALAGIGYAITPDGVLGEASLDAVRGLFADSGYELPTRTETTTTTNQAAPNAAATPGPTEQAVFAKIPVIPASAFLAIPSASVTVLTAAGVATTISEQTPFVTLRTSARFVSARADAATAAQLQPQDSVTITAGSLSFSGAIASIGAFDAGGEGRIPGNDIAVTTDDAQFNTVATGTQVQVTRQTTAAPQLAVPITALRHDADGDYVLVSDGEKTNRVAITILNNADGWAAVTSPELAAGNTVLL